jgi:hypothetical protein
MGASNSGKGQYVCMDMKGGKKSLLESILILM